MVPEDWLPTCTVVTACKTPVAVTVLRRLPRSTLAVMYSAALARLLQKAKPAKPAIATRPTMIANLVFLPTFSAFNFVKKFRFVIFICLIQFLYQNALCDH